MLKEFTDIAPKALLAAAVLWAGANYLIIAPEAGARIARADHLDFCRATIEQAATGQQSETIAALPKPEVNAAQEAAADRLRNMENSILGEWMRDPALEQMFGLGSITNRALAQYEADKRAAQQAYDGAVNQIKSATAARIRGADDACGCLAEAALNEWTVFTATLGLLKPAPVQNFGQRMMQQDAGTCAKAGA